MKIMGIDPGLAKVGWGIIEILDDRNTVLIDHGCLSTSAKKPIVNRLSSIYKEIYMLVEKYEPREVSIEEIFFAKNAKSAINVAQARGVILLALDHSQSDVYEYTPLQIKQALVGYGKAGKEQVMYMVKNFLKLEQMPATDHESDALAAAICHDNYRKLNKVIKG
jgi:crossover junction endodeoxyribonuclease RuvC